MEKIERIKKLMKKYDNEGINYANAVFIIKI